VRLRLNDYRSILFIGKNSAIVAEMRKIAIITIVYVELTAVERSKNGVVEVMMVRKFGFNPEDQTGYGDLALKGLSGICARF
jgi:hypothetical protein